MSLMVVLAPLDHKVLLAHKVQRVRTVLMVLPELQAQLDHKVRRAQRVRQVLWVHKVQREQRARKARKVIRRRGR